VTAKGKIMTNQAQRDPLRAALARSTALTAARKSKIPVRVLGFSAGSPALDDGGPDPAATLGAAVAAYDAALAAETRPPSLKDQRAARVRHRLWPPRS
jgi:hypothetical protein